MGTAQVQGDLWGAQARDWAANQEGMQGPIYDAVFDALGVTTGTKLLDVGCGAGLAALLAAQRGAAITGLDASAPIIDIARERVPGGDFRVGEIEDLPFADATFDVVTGFNSFQYAADPVAALREATRVVTPGGRIAMAVWGRREDCEHAVTLAAIGACLPPPPPGAAGPFALSERGRVEGLMRQAGLTPRHDGEVDCPFDYADDDSAWRALRSSGPAERAVRHAGTERVKEAVLASLQPFKTDSGGYRQENKFRYVIATA